MSFLDRKHGEDWAIWEFRAEGTGYPDHLVYDRIRHYPFPDHHPPPFRLMPMMLASMRNWLHGGDLEVETDTNSAGSAAGRASVDATEKGKRRKNRVVVVHCKAGKGRSGTVSCSYLIAEEGWKAEDALSRFTERRMRFGGGVTIPSQLRWVSYVDRWAHHGKKYHDRPIEVMEIHVWGLRNGVKVDVRGYVDEGKKIQLFHTFKREERMLVRGDAPEAGGIGGMVWDLAGYTASMGSQAPEEAELLEAANAEDKNRDGMGSAPMVQKKATLLRQKGQDLIQRASPSGSIRRSDKTHTITPPSGNQQGASESSSDVLTEPPEGPDPGGMAVILKPEQPIQVPTNDVNIAVELRNRAGKNIGLTMVSAVAHVWFNAFFEGGGPEQGGRPDDSGVFTINWDAMDGIKGSSRKGARALDRISVVWRAADGGEHKGEAVDEPAEGQPVPQMKPANWKGADAEPPESDLGLRTQSPMSADVSKASSVHSTEIAQQQQQPAAQGNDDDAAWLANVKSSDPQGGDLTDRDGETREDGHEAGAPVRIEISEHPDTASETTKQGGSDVV